MNIVSASRGGRNSSARTDSTAEHPDPSASAELLTATAAECLSALAEGVDLDWSRRAGPLDWSCRATLDHLALGLVGYAGLLIARPVDRYITLFASLDPEAPIENCLEGLHIAATLLSSTIRHASPDVRAWHPWGRSDPTGFAAMGLTELLVHTHDVTRVTNPSWTPPPTPSAAAVARIFRGVPQGDHSPSDALLWATGRLDLPGVPRRREWRWHGD